MNRLQRLLPRTIRPIISQMSRMSCYSPATYAHLPRLHIAPRSCPITTETSASVKSAKTTESFEVVDNKNTQRLTKTANCPFTDVSTADSPTAKCPSVVKLSPGNKMLKAYLALSKIHIGVLVSVTTFWGYSLVHTPFSPGAVGIVLGTVLLSNGAAAINQILETDVDAKMPRTSGRPLVTGVITIENATKYAAASITLGTVLTAVVSPTAAMLGFLNALFYGFVYTYSKRKTALNSEIGAIVGAVPPLMGYFAGLPPDAPWNYDLMALIYPAAIMVGWQLQHIMFIFFMQSQAYNNSGLVMQCKNDTNLVHTRGKGAVWAILTTLMTIGAMLYYKDNIWCGHAEAALAWTVYTLLYIRTMMYSLKRGKHTRTLFLYGYLLLAVTILGNITNVKYNNYVKAKTATKSAQTRLVE